MQAKKLPESPKNSQFLMELPKDLGGQSAIDELTRKIRPGVESGMLPVATVVNALRETLGLKSASLDSTVVFINATLEAQEIAGYPDPLAILGKLLERRAQLAQTLE